MATAFGFGHQVGLMARSHWSGSRDVEEQIKNDLKVTIRVIPFGDGEAGKCIFTGEPSAKREAAHFIVGMTNSAPSLVPEGQREVTVLVLV